MSARARHGYLSTSATSRFRDALLVGTTQERIAHFSKREELLSPCAVSNGLSQLSAKIQLNVYRDWSLDKHLDKPNCAEARVAAWELGAMQISSSISQWLAVSKTLL